MSQIEVATAAYRVFVSEFQSLMLGTVSKNGIPNVSYTPFVIDESKNIYIYVSGLSTHTQNLYTAPLASVMFIEDELQSQQIFARRRLTYDCSAALVERDTELWNEVLQRYEERFGEIIKTFRDLPDFRIFQLKPNKGKFVIGFGAAYNVSASDLDVLTQVTDEEEID
ncbi:MAG: pyridoxamine 5'-phosphate oxidase family protein [Calothrix sp. C42_A2020_038]|nr:pyridoxamine 5'-phosphate oxidase family protein [Calothrix sp. C42_A2020_038]